ncbi:hypothetical protein [Actinoplanes sp. GCM10030250]|uniref:hypothetical protein n=1 Tax=Actinoplanes sp. GCM10030250 TaxID=3273376 RepID=UPI00360C8CD0
MQNLYDGLERIAGPGKEPTPDQIEADMVRGRSALRRRRVMQSATGSAFAVAAVAAAFAFATAGTTAPTTPQPQAANPATATEAPAPSGPSIQLVAYKGEQPKGFILDKVPDGWEIQGVDAGVMTLAPIGIKDQQMHSFEGKVAVMLQSRDETGTPKGEKVTVGKDSGVLGKYEDQTDGWNLLVNRQSGPRLQVQVWDGLGWTGEQVVEFAAGITVTKDAQQGAG